MLTGHSPAARGPDAFVRVKLCYNEFGRPHSGAGRSCQSTQMQQFQTRGPDSECTSGAVKTNHLINKWKPELLGSFDFGHIQIIRFLFCFFCHLQSNRKQFHFKLAHHKKYSGCSNYYYFLTEVEEKSYCISPKHLYGVWSKGKTHPSLEMTSSISWVIKPGLERRRRVPVTPSSSPLPGSKTLA